MRSASGRSSRSAAAAAPWSSAKADASSASSSSAPASRSTSAASPARAAAGSRGPKAWTSTPGGPRRVRAGSSGSSIAAHRLRAVWPEPTSTPRAPASPSRAQGLKRGCGLTVYSSALPWIFTA